MEIVALALYVAAMQLVLGPNGTAAALSVLFNSSTLEDLGGGGKVDA